MIADLKPYSAMKDSGVPWLGAVPEHWGVRRLKHVLRERNMRSSDGTEQLLRVSQFTGITERKRADSGDEPDTRAHSLVGYKVVQPSELVVNIMLAWNGSMGVSAFAGIASPAYCVYRFGADTQPWYFHHLLRSPAYKARIKAVSTGVLESRLRLYTEDLYRLEALIPPLPEQAAIVRFLDHADRRIRRYIRAKQKLINLLEEQKQGIIHGAVTRGLDPNVPVRPSGVEWLGDVPEHWQVRRVHAVFRERKQTGRPDLPILVVSIASGVTRGEQIDEDGRPKRLIADKALYKVAREGDIAYNMMRMWQGAVGVVPADGLVSPAYVVAEPDLDVNAGYFALLFRTDACKGDVVTRSRGIVDDRNRLYWDAFKDVRVPFPPPREQNEIVRWIETQASSIGRSIDRVQREVAFLREYRTRLIADVVTGKLDVRVAAARLPNEAEEPELQDEPEGLIDAEEATADDLDVAPEEAEA